VVLRGSLAQARLAGASSAGSRWLDVRFQDTLCPDGQRLSTACPGFQVPRSVAARQRAEARVAALRARPWPQD
jgi:hypothetical protein